MIKLSNFLLVILIVFAGCKSKQPSDQEVQKLLNRQAQTKESQEGSVDELQNTKDSLEKEKNMLIVEREQKDREIKQMEKNQELLMEGLKKEEEAKISTEKNMLTKQITQYEDSIALLKNEVSVLDANIDSFERSLSVYELQEEQAGLVLESGIREIDRRIASLQNQKQQEVKNIDLLERRIEISGKKIETYELERQMYADERDELLRTSAQEEELIPYREKIAEMDSIIEAEEINKKNLSSDLNDTKQWISEVDNTISDLDEKIKLEYNKKEIIEGFITSEKVRLEKEITTLRRKKEELIYEHNKIFNDLAGSEQKVATLDKEMELINNKDMSELLEKQVAIEESEAALADEEIRLLEESAGIEDLPATISPESSSEELNNIIALSNQIDSLRESIQEEKSDIVKTRKELSQKRAESAKTRSRSGRTVTFLVVLLILVGAGVMALFYFLGKRARKY
jgi:chromosome segregation ATPase